MNMESTGKIGLLTLDFGDKVNGRQWKLSATEQTDVNPGDRINLDADHILLSGGEGGGGSCRHKHQVSPLISIDH